MHIWEYCSATWRNELLVHAVTWITWKHAKWKKKKTRPQVEAILWFHLYEKSRVGNPSRQKADQWLSGAGEGRNAGWLLMGAEFPFGMRRVFWEWCLYVIKQTTCCRAVRFHVACAHCTVTLVSFSTAFRWGDPWPRPVRRGKFLWQRIKAKQGAQVGEQRTSSGKRWSWLGTPWWWWRSRRKWAWGQGGSLKRQVEGSEMTLSQMGSRARHTRTGASCSEGPGTFQWAKDRLVGTNFYLKIDNQVYSPLTVAYFVVDKSFFFFFLFLVLLLVEEETEK